MMKTESSVSVRFRSAYREREAYFTGVAVLAAVALAIGLWFGARALFGDHAPPASALPLAPGIDLVVAHAGRGQVESVQPGQWQYMIISGRAGESDAQLMRTEVRTLRHHGWDDVVTSKGSPSRRHLRVGTPGSWTSLDSRRDPIYAVLDTVRNRRDLDEQTQESPIFGDAAAYAALASGRPVLAVTLGNDSHS